jgi:hypothetical protein
MKLLMPWIAVGGLAVAAAAVLGGGCKVESADSDVSIEPDTVQMSVGEEQEFAASGGFTYTWWLEHEDQGYLNTRTGDRVIYTRRTPSTNTCQTLHVRSTIEGEGGGGGGTNATSPYEKTAEAYIYNL